MHSLFPSRRSRQPFPVSQRLAAALRERRLGNATTFVSSSLLIFALSGCGDPPEPVTLGEESDGSEQQNPSPNEGGNNATKTPSGSNKTTPSSNAPVVASKVKLDEETLGSWIAAMVDLRETGSKMSQDLKTDPNALKGYLNGLAASEGWKEALSEHGYTIESFRDVSDQISQGWGAVLMEDHQGSLQTAMNQQLDAMKNLPGVTEAQMEGIRAQMEQNQQQVADVANGATDETKALIKKYRAKLEAAFQ